MSLGGRLVNAFGRFFIFVVLSGIPGGPLPAAADAHPGSVYASVFANSYGQEGTIYFPGQCGRNAKQLLLELRKNGFDIQNASAIFLLSEFRQIAGGPFLATGLVPAYSRQHVSSWDFHVVLRVKDSLLGRSFILDLDGPARPMEIKSYFSFMFPNPAGGHRWDNIQIKEITATRYLEAFENYNRTRDPNLSYDENYVVGDFRRAKASEPTMSLAAFLVSNR